MKKLSCLLLLMFALCACHGQVSKTAFTIPDTLDESVTQELTFWAKNDTNKAQTKVYEQAIADFEKLYPNIKINIRLYTDYGRIYNDVITNIATNTMPDICITYPDHIATYLTGNNSVVALDDLFHDEKYGFNGSQLKWQGPDYEDVVPSFLQECYLNGHYFALPYMRSTEACYINKDYVEKLGYEIPEVLTWDFIWEVSEAAMAKNPDGTYALNGQKVLIPFIYKSTDNMMIQYLRQAGADYSDENGQIGLFNDTTKDFLKTIASHTQTGAFSTFKISGYPGNFLNAGQCIFAIDSTAGATWMGSDAPLMDIHSDKVVRFETVIKPIPQVDPANPKMISQGPSVCIFNKGDNQKVLASWLFMQFLLNDKTQTAYAMTEGYIPVTQSAIDSDTYQNYLKAIGTDNDTHYSIKIQASELLIDHVSDTFITPVFNGSASLRDAAGQLIEDVAKSVRRKQTVDDVYLDELYDSTSAMYHLDTINAQNGAMMSQSGKQQALPWESKLLLGSMVVIWAGLIIVRRIKH